MGLERPSARERMSFGRMGGKRPITSVLFHTPFPLTPTSSSSHCASSRRRRTGCYARGNSATRPSWPSVSSFSTRSPSFARSLPSARPFSLTSAPPAPLFLRGLPLLRPAPSCLPVGHYKKGARGTCDVCFFLTWFAPADAFVATRGERAIAGGHRTARARLRRGGGRAARARRLPAGRLRGPHPGPCGQRRIS